jgi:hypothetical protein
METGGAAVAPTRVSPTHVRRGRGQAPSGAILPGAPPATTRPLISHAP